MKKLILSLGTMLLLTASCQTESFDNVFVDQESINIEELTGVQRDIMVNILSSKYGGYRKGQPATRAMNYISLSPYIENGDTLLYIVQYPQGWEIYSASRSANMLLFSSDSGVFSIDDPTLPQPLRSLITENAAVIKNLTYNSDNSDNAKIDPSWGGIALNDDELAKGNITRISENNSRVPVYDGEYPPGHWVLIETEKVNSKTYTSPKLIETKWGQSYPWNQYTKWILDKSDNTLKQAVAGCVPVAVSQYMYFTHYKEGIPLTSVTNATLSDNGLDYTFFGSSSLIWDNMAKYYYQNGTKESALLIGYVGRELNSIYGIESTGTYINTCANYLTNLYNDTFKIETFNFDNIVNSIDNGFPVISRASSANGGHTFIIDQYQTTVNTQRYLYGLVRDPLPDGEKDKWMADLVDENGNIIIYAYTSEVFQDFKSEEVSMNWGYNGNYDNIFYSGNWKVGDTEYSLKHQTYTRIK